VTFLLVSGQNYFPEERVYVLREYAKELYTIPQYFVARSAVEFPFFVLGHVCFVITYYMMNFTPGIRHVLLYLLILFLGTQASAGISGALGAYFSTTETLTLVNGVMFLMLMFTGLFLNSTNTPKYFLWLQDISIYHYVYPALLRNELEDRTFYCKESQLTLYNTCPVTDGMNVYTDYGFSIEIWFAVVILVCMVVVFRILGFVMLLIVCRRWKRRT